MDQDTPTSGDRLQQMRDFLAQNTQVIRAWAVGTLQFDWQGDDVKYKITKSGKVRGSSGRKA